MRVVAVSCGMLTTWPGQEAARLQASMDTGGEREVEKEYRGRPTVAGACVRSGMTTGLGVQSPVHMWLWRILV